MKNNNNFLTIIFTIVILLSFLAALVVMNDNEFDDTSGQNYISDTSNSKECIDESFASEPSDDTSTITPEPLEDSVVSFLACPDNLIHPCIYYDALERAAENNNLTAQYDDLHNQTYDFRQIYTNLEDMISSADISYINQESLIGGTSRRPHGYPCFNTPNAMGNTVVDIGFDLVNVAHNHMLDSGNTDFLEHCNEFFESKSVDVIGYYPDESSTENITVIEKNGIKIAFLTYTYGTNGFELDNKSDFVIPYFDEELISKQVEIAKNISDFVIVSCHWGDENTHKVNWTQNHQAEFLTELEVDVVLGMHPHCIQPMEWKTSSNGKRTLVVYSLGNFVSGMDRGINNLGCMLSLQIIKDAQTGEITLDSPTAIPFVNHYIKAEEVASDDKGYRDYTIYLLKDYTEDLAAIHGAHSYEAQNGTTLEGGAFSKQNLINTYNKYIAAEFHPIDN